MCSAYNGDKKKDRKKRMRGTWRNQETTEEERWATESIKVWEINTVGWTLEKDSKNRNMQTEERKRTNMREGERVRGETNGNLNHKMTFLCGYFSDMKRRKYWMSAASVAIYELLSVEGFLCLFMLRFTSVRFLTFPCPVREWHLDLTGCWSFPEHDG